MSSFDFEELARPVDNVLTMELKRRAKVLYKTKWLGTSRGMDLLLTKNMDNCDRSISGTLSFRLQGIVGITDAVNNQTRKDT